MRIKLPARRKLVAQLDALFSMLVRLRDKRTRGCCPFHPPGVTIPIECAFHFVRKSRSLRLRWDKRNAVGACVPCNGYMEFNEGPFWTWYAREYGVDAMEVLQRDSHGLARFSRSDLVELRDNMRSELENGGWHG